MRNLLKLAALVVVMAFTAFSGTVAEPPTLKDWQEIEDSLRAPGDHVVGEELCARPR